MIISHRIENAMREINIKKNHFSGSGFVFTCDNGNTVNIRHWVCDNYDDCGDNSDERNCSNSTPGPTMAPTTGELELATSIPSFHFSHECVLVRQV